MCTPETIATVAVTLGAVALVCGAWWLVRLWLGEALAR